MSSGSAAAATASTERPRRLGNVAHAFAIGLPVFWLLSLVAG